MGKTLNEATRYSRNYSAPVEPAARLDWRKRMSDNVAYALIVYTAINIVATMGAMKATGLKSLALLALVVLVAGIIPACRWFERRWRNLSDEAAADPALSSTFRRDQILLWLLAIGLPVGLTMLLQAAAAAL
ncbi:MAG: hypothetical protein WA908_03535 [Pontixanthobacter sp.]